MLSNKDLKQILSKIDLIQMLSTKDLKQILSKKPNANAVQ